MKLPTKLSYKRSLDPSPVIFLVHWPDGTVTPLRSQIIGNRGMFEGAHVAYTPAGEIKNVNSNKLAEGNLHEIECCNVPYGAKHVECQFSLTVSNEAMNPGSCNDHLVTNNFRRLVQAYDSRIGLEYIATRYLQNIIDGAWLWDNKKVNSSTIQLTTNKGVSIEANDFLYKRFNKGWQKELPNWHKLVDLFVAALRNERDYLSIEVSASLVYPSQKTIKPSQKLLTHQPKGQGRRYQSTSIDGDESPIFGTFKTGAAIAMIDDWYPNAERPLRINHYGVDSQNGMTYRHPDTELDLFTLIKRTEDFIERLNSDSPLAVETINQLHFIIANLIKGGPLQSKGD
ncbi:type I-F CRISPR-associated protein Csy3 [Thaumasiovibrio sp. DFM-14]|uniref:type I-F CRISPR-associated protein Csy3 n=1 Tax=Thaumasiovibrio sp. DFM-14 TaxID=3384792 RepID=UPI0039A2EFB1